MEISTLCLFFTLLILIVITIRAYFKSKFQYWRQNGVPYLEPSIPFGTINNPLFETKSLPEILQKQYMESKSKGYKYFGIYAFTSPQLVILDPKLIKCVLSKGFNHFMERGLFSDEEEPLTMHLFSLGTSKWRKLRPKLTPTFTSGKMKMMFNTIKTCGYQLENYMADICAKGPVDIKQVLEYYTIDVIGSCAFGIDCNSFTDPSNDFRKYAKRIFSLSFRERIKSLIAHLVPSVRKLFGLKIIPRDITDFFINMVRHSVQLRQESGLMRNDFLQILMELVNNKEKKDSISFNEMVAQVFVFFIAGFETSSATMTFCLLELCLNPAVQNKLRAEVNSVLDQHNGGLTYESLKAMKYMDTVIDETLRKYPPLPVLNRQCIQDYHVPDTKLTIRKGIKIAIPLVAIQSDPEYFPCPEKFDPARFSTENRGLIAPFTYMPFGEGPRACIGIRFGIMQTKVGLSALLKNYKFSLSEKMVLPIKFKVHSFITAVDGGVWLDAAKI